MPDLRIGGFLFTGIGGAFWLLFTKEQYSGWSRAAALSGLERAFAGLFLVWCFVVAYCFTLGFRSRYDHQIIRIIFSVLLLMSSAYFTIRGFDRLDEPSLLYEHTGWLFWKFLITGIAFLFVAAVFGTITLVSQGKEKRPNPLLELPTRFT